ncbi:DnaJ domain-containing protein [Winogradskyella sediminis]|uniref:DnaJ domain-containing protein n=1 Tax=Winogradskyella sediminis TaxID=1382466 RepID=UPI003AA98745
MFPDYYKILRLNQNVTKNEIKKAYRELALEFHPDKNNSPNAHEKFIEINEAYLILYDDEAREKYDREYNYNFSKYKEQKSSDYGHSKETYKNERANQRKTEHEQTFSDSDLNDWAKKAKTQGAEYARMAFDDFAKMVLGFVKETGFQLGNTLLVFLGLMLTLGGCGNLVIGLSTSGEIGNPVFGLIMLPIGILLWRAANNNWEKH